MSRRVAWAATALGLLTLLLYLPALGGDFVNWDDGPYVLENGAVQRLDGSTVAWAFTDVHSYNWHPLTWLSHAVDYALFGANPWGHHLTSVLIHALNAALLAWVLWQFTARAGRSLLVAALFAAHPLHVESVAWIAVRKDVLSGLFWIATLAAYGAYAKRGGLGRYALVLLAFACGLMSKPMVVTLPLVLLLLDFWPLGRLGRRAIVEKIPMLLMSFGSATITMIAQRAGGSTVSLEQLDVGSRLAHAVVNYGRYLFKLFWPFDLVPYYPYASSDATTPVVVLLALLLAGITLAVLLVRKRAPWLVVGWFWYGITLLPVIGLIQVGSASIADRYTYLPLIGPFLIIAWGVGAWSARRNSALAAGVIGTVWVIALSVITVGQIGIWSSSTTLWERAVGVYPESVFIRNKLADAWTSAGEPDRGAEQYRRAIELQPAHVESLNDLGKYHYRKDELVAAEALFLRAIEARPADPHAFNLLGLVRTRQQRNDEAVALYRKALERNPGYLNALNNLGVALVQRGDLDGAIDTWQRSIELESRDTGTLSNLARAYEMRGEKTMALRTFERILEIDPEDAEARRALERLRGE